IAWFGFAILPWNAIGGRGFFAFQWLWQPLTPASASALVQLVWHGRLWFLPLLIVLLVPLALAFRLARGPEAREPIARTLIVTGIAGLAWIAAIALAIDINGWTWKPLALVFGDLPGRQPGLGYGAAVLAA